MTPQIRRVLVWSGWLRLVHGATAAAVVLMLVTGWLIRHSPSLAEGALDLHYLGASLVLFALALRLFLGFFVKGAERFEHMIPRASELPALRASALFYLSLGKAPLPNWFAHNPLWKLLYLMLFVMLALLAFTGWQMPQSPLMLGIYLPHLHAGLATLVGVWVAAHLYCVLLQDIKGNNADVSAMLNGNRYFTIEKEGLVKPEVQPVSIKLGDIDRSKRG